MLRHKRIIHLSLYNFRKHLKFYDCRNFHTTECFFLRRIASSRKVHPEVRSAPEETGVAGNFESQPLTKTFNNFYGIESDEGVIHIKDQPNPIKSSQDSFIHKFTSKQMSEKLKKTSFGKVRLDSENKVIIHGQFEENSSISDINEIDEAPRLRKFAIANYDSHASPSVDEASLPSVENIDFIKSKYDTSIQSESIKNSTDLLQKVSKIDTANNNAVRNDISLIDQSYFPEKFLKDEQQIFSNSPTSKESVYIDELDSKRVNNDGTFSITSAISDVGNAKFSDGSLHENHELLEEKPSFFDELIFGSRLESKNVEVKESSISEITSEPVVKNNELLQTAPVSNNENTSFIDEYYFNDRLEEKLIEKDSKRAIENINLSEVSLIDNVSEKSRSHGIEKEGIINQSETEIKVKNNERNKDKFSSYGLDTTFLNRMSNESEPSILNSHKLNQTFHNDIPMLRDKNNTNKFANYEEVKEQLDAISTPSSMPISSFNEGLPSDKNTKVPDKSRPNRTKVHESNETLSSNEANDEKQSQDKEPQTAFDYVKKLRGEKAPTYNEKISGFSKSPKEKLDSQGFRILKYQVPELKYYTRDEMLELLVKNVLYSDDDVIVLNKPYNLVMHESKTTKDACLSKYLDDLAGELDKKSEKPKLLTVHRLDKETTGCLLLARNEKSAQYLKNLFAQRKIVKTYWIVTVKVPDPLQGIIDIPIAEGLIDNKSRMVLHPNLPKDVPYRNHSKHGKNAVTRYSVIAESGNAALVEVKPETGIKHQIRVHFGFGLGCPILGDHKYTYPDKLVPQKLQADLLHKLRVRQSKVRYIPMHIYARSLFIPQYSEGRNLFVMAPMPIHMSKNLQSLKFKKK